MSLLDWLDSVDQKLGFRGGPTSEDELASQLPPGCDLFAEMWRVPYSGVYVGPLSFVDLIVDAAFAARSRFWPGNTLWVIVGDRLFIHRIWGLRRARIGKLILECPMHELKAEPSSFWRSPDPFGIRIELCNGGRGRFRSHMRSPRALRLVTHLLSDAGGSKI